VRHHTPQAVYFFFLSARNTKSEGEPGTCLQFLSLGLFIPQHSITLKITFIPRAQHTINTQTLKVRHELFMFHLSLRKYRIKESLRQYMFMHTYTFIHRYTHLHVHTLHKHTRVHIKHPHACHTYIFICSERFLLGKLNPQFSGMGSTLWAQLGTSFVEDDRPTERLSATMTHSLLGRLKRHFLWRYYKCYY
jgi:hypothetical protein